MVDNEKISLFDLWEKLRDGWRYVIGGVLLGLLGAAAVLALIQPQYEARALLQTGKVAGSVIEDASMVVERLKSPSFLLEVAQDIGDQKWIEQIDHGNGAQILTAQVPKTSPSMVDVKVKAGTPDYAKKIADAATAKLIKRQNELSIQVLEKIRFDLRVAKEKLARIEQDILMLSKTLSSAGVKDDRFSQVSLMMSLKLQKESEMFAIRQSVYAMEISLLPPSTQPARVLEAIFASTKPVSPNKRSVIALGSVGGLLAGVMWVLVAGAWRRARERRLIL